MTTPEQPMLAHEIAVTELVKAGFTEERAEELVARAEAQARPAVASEGLLRERLEALRFTEYDTNDSYAEGYNRAIADAFITMDDQEIRAALASDAGSVPLQGWERERAAFQASLAYDAERQGEPGE